MQFVARIERSEIRGRVAPDLPDFAMLYPGYGSCNHSCSAKGLTAAIKKPGLISPGFFVVTTGFSKELRLIRRLSAFLPRSFLTLRSSFTLDGLLPLRSSLLTLDGFLPLRSSLLTLDGLLPFRSSLLTLNSFLPLRSSLLTLDYFLPLRCCLSLYYAFLRGFLSCSHTITSLH